MSFLEYQPIYHWKNRFVPKSLRKFPLFMLETVPFKLAPMKPHLPQLNVQNYLPKFAVQQHKHRISYPIDRNTTWFPCFKAVIRKVVKRNEIDDAFWLTALYLDHVFPKSSSLKPLFVLLYELSAKQMLETYSKDGLFFNTVDQLILKVPDNLKPGVNAKLLKYLKSERPQVILSKNIGTTVNSDHDFSDVANGLQLKPSLAPALIENMKSKENVKEIVRLIKDFKLLNSPSVQMALVDSMAVSSIPEQKLNSDLNIFHQLKSNGAIMSQEIANRLIKSFANANLPLVALSFSEQILTRHSLPVYKKSVDAIVFSILRKSSVSFEDKKLLRSLWEILGTLHSKRRLVQITRACFKVQDFKTLNEVLNLVKEMEPAKKKEMLYYLSKSVGNMNSILHLNFGFDVLKIALDTYQSTEHSVYFHLNYLDGICTVYNLFSYFKFLIDRNIRITDQRMIDKVRSVFSKLSESNQNHEEVVSISSHVIYIVNEAVDQIISSDASIKILDTLLKGRADA